MTLVLVSGPAIEPVDLPSLQLAARVDGSDEDDILESLALAGRLMVERLTNRALISQTWRLELDGWPAGNVIRIPAGPVASITGVTYIDAAGATQTLAADQYVCDALPLDAPRIVPAPYVCWPCTQARPGAVKVTFVAGYGALAPQVPEPLRQAIRMLAVHWFENRGGLGPSLQSTLPLGPDALISGYRLPLLA